MKVKLYLFTHPQWHLVLGYYKAIAPSYILSQIEWEAKGYGIKNSIANIMNQLTYTLKVTNVLEYSSQGRALLLLVSKQNLKPFSWCI
jgi:hypothetical protein